MNLLVIIVLGGEIINNMLPSPFTSPKRRVNHGGSVLLWTEESDHALECCLLLATTLNVPNFVLVYPTVPLAGKRHDSSFAAAFHWSCLSQPMQRLPAVALVAPRNGDLQLLGVGYADASDLWPRDQGQSGAEACEVGSRDAGMAVGRGGRGGRGG